MRAWLILASSLALLALPLAGGSEETDEQRARALLGLTTQLKDAQMMEAQLNAQTTSLQAFRAHGLAFASKLSQQKAASKTTGLSATDLQAQALGRYIALDLSLSLDAAMQQLEPLDAVRVRVRSLNDAVETLRSALMMEGLSSDADAAIPASRRPNPSAGPTLPEGVYRQPQSDFRAFPPLEQALDQKPLVLPLKQYEVLRAFGVEDPKDPAGVFLKGILLTAPANATVFAPFEGKIVYATPYRSFGNLVVIEHEGEGATLVSGLHSFAISVGDWVRQGAPLGLMAPSTGGSNSTTQANRLYFEFRIDQQLVDPLALVGSITNE